MDTITHGVAGALIGKALFDEQDGPWPTASVTLGSIFPDSDLIVSLFDKSGIAMLQYHRGITHSFVMLPIFSILLAWITARVSRQPSRWKLFSLCYAVGISSHILFDLITSYGTMIWSPISWTRYHWDITFIVDLVFVSIALLPQLVAWVYSKKHSARSRGMAIWLIFSLAALTASLLTRSLGIYISFSTVLAVSITVAGLVAAPSIGNVGFAWSRRFYCRIGVAVLALYLAASAEMHASALRIAGEFANSKSAKGQVTSVAALPAPPFFYEWSGLVATRVGVYRAPISLSGAQPPSFTFFEDEAPAAYLQKAEALPDVKTYLWFARFPWTTLRNENGLVIVEIQDLQFYFPMRGRRIPFTYRVSFRENGTIVSAGLLRR